jgi:PAT family beta-lactamase induction signal transducer AmpG
MTHYAFATALMNFALPPTTMISGPLAEWLGFSTYFIVVMFASVPSVLAAWLAPHPLGDATRGREGDGDASVVTIDDPSRLAPTERSVQLIAGRASVFAILNILTILIVDAWALGTLHGLIASENGSFLGIPIAGGAMRQAALVVLAGSVVLKLFFSVRTFAIAREARAAATAGTPGEAAYLGNARGAKITTAVCGLLTALVLFVAVRLAF